MFSVNLSTLCDCYTTAKNNPTSDNIVNLAKKYADYCLKVGPVPRNADSKIKILLNKHSN